MRFIVLGVCLFATSLFAFDISICGEGLLMRPSVPARYYAILGPAPAGNLDPPTGRQLTLCPSYDWGYRVRVDFRSCAKDLRLTWTSFNQTYRTAAQATGAQAIFESQGLGNSTPPAAIVGGRAEYRQSYNYYVFDGDIGRWSCDPCSRVAKRMFVGLRYARIKYKSEINYFLVTGTVDELVRFGSDNQGVGPRLGLSLDYHVCRGFGVEAGLGAELLIGSTKGSFRDNPRQSMNGRLITAVGNSSSCLLIPGVDLNLGLSYSMPTCWCVDFIGTAGYELVHYRDAIQLALYPDDFRNSLNVAQLHSFNMDGFYFRLCGKF